MQKSCANRVLGLWDYILKEKQFQLLAVQMITFVFEVTLHSISTLFPVDKNENKLFSFNEACLVDNQAFLLKSFPFGMKKLNPSKFACLLVRFLNLKY